MSINRNIDDIKSALDSSGRFAQIVATNATKDDKNIFSGKNADAVEQIKGLVDKIALIRSNFLDVEKKLSPNTLSNS
tara:strand:- start:508 stop:738 length:231 start_codon:yes stop_codon:yes gene_type:complete